MIKRIISYKIIILTVLLCNSLAFSQTSNKRKELETRRQELRREIQKISQLRAEDRSKERSELSQIEEYNYKISVLGNLIKVTNQQANYINREINLNQNKISNLRDELKQLKEDYAAMVVKSYKSKNQHSRIMFLLSSKDFKQAYKRLQYIKQYSNHQRQQGEIIKAKTVELQELNNDLFKQQEEKKKLIAENRVTQKALESERRLHEDLMKSIRKNLTKYTLQIRQKQSEAARIDREIDKIIKEAIASSNKAAGKSGTSTSFALTPAEKVLASNFVANKGRLPWPVERGRVSRRYGSQPSQIDRSLTINSSGVGISTNKGAKVFAVFNGEVSSIIKIKNANPMVMIRHGNYLTIYQNLSKIYVKKGDKVTTRQVIGEVYTNPSNGETVLTFVISKGLNKENPANWIDKM
ncbi:peptidoglycan DD-metalloendopeptidase family protein [Seonamhaeicola sediminis]|uniref:Peptidoglycan DD-metalloendopeptidase family protein n=1 Tax=Seonamhaeicola sediminis TaxID=2528206 RepID=A0A562YGD8_9FLAO|nr:peptidoglycan DD-metalloendopeptidase family protein [Seonamhaeicola sediminis]TWO33943.1 peptidoglycan DD-metalloendopeptidase family protein [Seonamhaeicola sediminis]